MHKDTHAHPHHGPHEDIGTEHSSRREHRPHPILAEADSSRCFCTGGKILTIRAVSGLSGDMMLAGLARMLGFSAGDLGTVLAALSLPLPSDCAVLEERSVNHIAGWGCRVTLPHEHAHRSLADIIRLIRESRMKPESAALAEKTFTLLAEAEGRVHGKPAAEVHFHETGALDSILDICLSAELFHRLAPAAFVCSPLPLADGDVHCAHGVIPSPAPAVLEMLSGIPVQGFSGTGETVTPTALALLKAFGAEFGPWPAMTVERNAIVYGTKIFENAPNGSLFAWGRA